MAGAREARYDDSASEDLGVVVAIVVLERGGGRSLALSHLRFSCRIRDGAGYSRN